MAMVVVVHKRSWSYVLLSATYSYVGNGVKLVIGSPKRRTIDEECILFAMVHGLG